MANTHESEINDAKPEGNIDINAPPGQLDASSGADQSAESETDHMRWLTEHALAVTRTAGIGSKNSITFPSEGSDGSEMEESNLAVTEELPKKIQAQSEAITSNAAAFGAKVVADELITSFDTLAKNDIARAALLASPALLLKTEKRGSGPMAVATDPKFLVPAAVASILIAKRVTKRITAVQIDRASVPSQALAVGTRFKLLTNADPDEVVWDTGDPAKATVDSEGVVTAVSSGDVSIIATLAKSSDVVAVAIR